MSSGCLEPSVEVSADLSKVPGDPRIAELMGMCLAGKAATDEQLQFRTLWQDRVSQILLDHADDPAVIGTSYS